MSEEVLIIEYGNGEPWFIHSSFEWLPGQTLDNKVIFVWEKEVKRVPLSVVRGVY